MGAVGARFRSEVRTSWRALLALALLIGLFAGVVLGVAAGARRTTSAFPRLVDESGPTDVLFAPFAGGMERYYERVAEERKGDVVAMGVMVGLPLVPLGPDGNPVFTEGNVLATVDGQIGYTLDRPKVIAGRLPAPDAADELLVNERFAAEFDVDVGDRIPMAAMRPGPDGVEGEPLVEPTTLTAVGIGRFIEEVVPTARFDSTTRALMSRAGYRKYGEGNDAIFFDAAVVRLRPDADIAAFRATAVRLGEELFPDGGGEVLFADNRQRNQRVERAIEPQAHALWLFAAFAGVAGFLVFGQALSRQLSDDGREAPILGALGMTRRGVVGLAMLRTALVAAGAVVVAVATAITLSPLFPIGAARGAEPNPGIEVNIAVLGLGAVVLVVLLLLRAAPAAWRLSRLAALRPDARAGASGGSALARSLSSGGLPPTAAAGIRMALEPGRGRSAVPVRATLAGAVVALAAIATTLTFAANLDRVVSTPALYGRTWDAFFDGSFGGLAKEPVEQVLGDSPIVEGWSGGFYGEAAVAGRAVTVVSADGELGPAIVDGRAPRARDEVALGTSTLERTKRRVGERVRISFSDGERSVRIVGRAVFPALGRGSFPSTGLGEGVLTTGSAIEPPPEAVGRTGNDFYNFFLMRLADDATPAQVRALERTLRPVCDEEQACGFTTDATVAERPAEIDNLDRIRWTPVVLAGLLGLLAIATVGHTLVTSIRRRRREFAMLKTLGFQRRQVSAAVAWQATTFAAVAALVGIPLGLALGRVMWRALADGLGIVPDVSTPVLALALAAPATVLLANIIALVPGLLAARIRPAAALRTE